MTAKIRENIKRLQGQAGAKADGLWGLNSQKALTDSGKRLAYEPGKLAKHFGPLKQSQVNGFDSILEACNQYGGNAINPLYFAYMLATTWHETARTMRPIEEYGKGRGRPYGSRIDIHGGRYSDLLPIYYGRGYVQLTWLTNYVLMRKLLGVDFVNKPELALDPKHAADIMIVGMLEGHFTGKSLSRYIRYGSFEQFKNARRVINGTDKDTLIAGYAIKFLDCLTLIK